MIITELRELREEVKGVGKDSKRIDKILREKKIDKGCGNGWLGGWGYGLGVGLSISSIWKSLSGGGKT